MKKKKNSPYLVILACLPLLLAAKTASARPFCTAEEPQGIFTRWHQPMIAIVIDDMGVDRKRSARATAVLDKNITLSYLPYAQNIQQQVDAARAKGHPIMLHLPWEAESASVNPGPHHLATHMTADTLQRNLVANLDGFTGYDGVNNHMGSKFSQFRPGLEIVMRDLKSRNMFFLDSKTIASSQAESVAQAYDIPSTRRDVFLDHTATREAVNAALADAERIARCEGAAVAIGHPKDVTIDALAAWAPTLARKGLRLVPVTAIIEYRDDGRTNPLLKGITP